MRETSVVGQYLDPAHDLALPQDVHACATTRIGGVSTQRHAAMDLGGERDANGRPADAVLRNREALRVALGLQRICFLDQVHGCAVHRVSGTECDQAPSADPTAGPTADPGPDEAAPVADGCVVQCAGVAACVLTADCLPVLFAHASGRIVAAAHAGWRGLAAGVLEQTLAAMAVPAAEVSVWLGPAIGPGAFEVGPEVRDAFLAAERAAAGEAERAALMRAFRRGRADRWHADLWALARHRLTRAGVVRIAGGGIDVHGRPEQFYSWRRDSGVTGRQATLIWISPPRPRS